MNAWYRELKRDILSKLDAIDKHCEVLGLSAENRIEQIELRAQLDRLLKQEEAKWKQRAKIDEILEGDGNTRFSMPRPMADIGRTKLIVWIKQRGR